MSALPKKNRFTENLFNQTHLSKKRFYGNFIIAKFAPANESRLGVQIRKKVCKKSTQRNYIRRVFCELFSKHQKLHGHLLIMIKKQPDNDTIYPLLKNEWTNLMEYIDKNV